MEQILDFLNDVNQQLEENGGTIDEDQVDEDQKGPTHSSPAHPTETSTAVSHLKFSTPSPNKSIVSPSKRHLVRSWHHFSFQLKKTLRLAGKKDLFIFSLLFDSDFTKDTTSLGGGPEKSPPDAVSAS